MHNFRLSETSNSSGSVVNYDHFGTNYLFTKEAAEAQHVSNSSLDYNGIRNDLTDGHETSVRFPGGTVAELYLDPGDINGHFSSDSIDYVNSIGKKSSLVSTQSFLEQAADNRWSVTFVLPTKRYLEKLNNDDTLAIYDEIYTYVTNVLQSAKNLGVEVDGFEVGNEWYFTGGLVALTPSQYGKIASHVALATNRAIADAAEANKPYIAIQTTKDYVTFSYGDSEDGFDNNDDHIGDIDEDNSATYNNLNDKRSYKPHEDLDEIVVELQALGAARVIDAVVGHFYSHNNGNAGSFNDYVTSDPSLKDQGIFEQLEYLETELGNELIKVISEWNVHTYINTSESYQNEYWGVRQVDPIMTMFGVMMAEGIDQANFWTVQSNIWNDLVLWGGGVSQAGGTSRRSATQDILDLMSDNLIGTRVLDVNGKVSDLKGSDRWDANAKDAASGLAGWVDGTEIRVHAYSSDEKTVFYFNSRMEKSETIQVDLGNYIGNGSASTLIELTRMKVDDLGEIKSHSVNSHTTAITTDTYTLNQFQDISSITLAPYETISIEVIYYPSLTKGETEVGHAGEDLMFGASGNDTMIGRDGTDRLYGRFGNDVLEGGAGSDYIEGGNGSDSIYGGLGDDKILGGKGQDFLSGGDGRDVFYFANGDGHDIVSDFASGIDQLVIENTSYDSLLDIPIGWFKVSSGGDLIVSHAGVQITFKFTAEFQVTYSDIYQEISPEFVLRPQCTLPDFSWQTSVAGKSDSNDKIYGSEGNDIIYGNGGNDTIYGNGGNDIIYGNEGNDTIYGNKGYDVIHGGAGDDAIYGQSQGNQLFGGEGNDLIDAGAHGSTVDGGAGADHIYAAMTKGGGHVLTGGAGADIFEFRYESSTKVDDAIITDFNTAEDTLVVMGQPIDLNAVPAGFTLTDTGDDLRLDYGDNDFVLLQGVIL